MNDKETCRLLLSATQCSCSLAQKHVFGPQCSTDKRKLGRVDDINRILQRLDLKAIRSKNRSAYGFSLIDASPKPTELRRQLWTKYPNIARRGAVSRGAYIIIRCLIAINDFLIPLDTLLEILQSLIPFPRENIVILKESTETRSWKEFIEHCIDSGWLYQTEEQQIAAIGEIAQGIIQEDDLVKYLYNRVGTSDEFDSFCQNKQERFAKVKSRLLERPNRTS